MVSPSDMHRLRASAARVIDAAAFAHAFDVALRGASPDFAARLQACPTGTELAILLPGAILALGEGKPCPAFQAFEALRQHIRVLPRHDAAIGRALIAALADSLGHDFDEATRDAWTNGYVALAEALVAARLNRIDLVA